MMKQNGKKITALILAAASAAAVLSACTRDSGADWEDTLPSAVTTTSESSVMVIEEDTKPPISISMPETTATTERKTELATTASAVTEETQETTSQSTITGISTVPAVDLTSTAVTTTVPTSGSSLVSSSETSTAGSSETRESTSDTETFSSEVSSTSETSSVTSAGEQDGEKPYVFNDPISRPYCYFTLDERLRQAYDLIINAIINLEDEVELPDELALTAEEYCDLYQMIYDSEHSVFYISTRMTYATKISTQTIAGAEFVYIYTEDEIKAMQKKTDEAANAIISEITEDMTEYDIVKLFYDKLAGEVIYDETAPNLRDIYGALVDKKAVCGGYAKAFSYLCDKVGIESLTITGDFDEIPHMWNMVKLDGEWYHVDATAGYVKNPVVPYIRYDYLCTSDEIVLRSRTVYEQSYSYPKAESMKYNYYVYNNLVADSVESAEKLLMDGIVAATEKGEGVIQIACSDDKVFEDVVYYLFDKSQANALNIYDKAYSNAAKKYNRESIIYNQEKNTRVIKLFLEYLD